MLTALTVNAQTINLRGKVADSDGKAIAGAIVELVNQKLMDTTGADGAYSIMQSDVAVLPFLKPQGKTISMNKGGLDFSFPEATPLKIETFDVKGNLLKGISYPEITSGFYRFDITRYSRGTKILVIRVQIGTDEVTFRYLPLSNGSYILNQTVSTETLTQRNRLTKIMAIDDTLKVTASGYNPKSVPITSYEQELPVTLEAEGNIVGRSAGCGKSTTLKGEQRLTINSGGKNREYIIRLPDDYNENTAYRLIMSIHCLNGSAQGVAKGGNGNNYEYYGLWKFANPNNGPGTTIFCSPEGLPSFGGGLGWSNGGGSDVEFIRALIKKFESDLCIDTTRIFAEGFSMGGSMSYALACAMPNKFRAVCMHSGGSMSGCDGTNRGPVPMFITHGTDDDVCRWTQHSGENQINDLAKRDGCDTEDLFNQCHPTNSNAVTVNYKNCDPGYPCKACIFKGGHDPSPGGERNTWVDDSTWNYFKQF